MGKNCNFFGQNTSEKILIIGKESGKNREKTESKTSSSAWLLFASVTEVSAREVNGNSISAGRFQLEVTKSFGQIVISVLSYNTGKKFSYIE